MAEISQSELKALFHYDPVVGVFIKKTKGYHSRHPQIGDIVHNVEKTGYIRLNLGGMRKLWAHRAAWLYVHGEIPAGFDIDHRNGKPSDNAIANLRLATKSQNLQNQRLRKTSKSGYRGVSFYTRTGQWRANISINKRHVSLGYFSTPEEASAAYEAKAKEVHGEFYYGLRKS